MSGTNYALEIKFSLTDPSGKTRHLEAKYPAFIASPVGAYIVTIPEGGTFELPAVDLVDYWSHEPKIAILALPAGRYTLTAEYRGHNPNDDLIPLRGRPRAHQYAQKFWIGAVRSNAVAFALTSPIGDQHPQ